MKKRILLLEDEIVNQRILDIILGREYHLTVVANGYEAFEWLSRHECPDLIIMDWIMPIMDGRTFLHELQFAPQFCHIPVIVLSSYEFVQDDLQKITFKTKYQLSKPVNPKILKQAVNEVIHSIAS